MPEPRVALVTGATGLIGGEVAVRLADRGYRVLGLTRGRDVLHCCQRLSRRLLRGGRTDCHGIVPICGDLSRGGLGLDEATRSLLKGHCNLVVHAAGETRFDATQACHAVNVDGTRRLVEEVAGWRSQPRVLFLSSAYVHCAPSPGGEIHEDDFQTDSPNAYVQSKRDAEQLLVGSGLGVIIIRPSVTLSCGLPDARFARRFLWLAQAAVALGAMPVRGDARLDIVNVAYVADSIVQLADRKLAWNCFHVTAGHGGSVTCGEMADLIRHRIGGGDVSFVSPQEWGCRMSGVPDSRYISSMVESLAWFMNASLVYANDRLREQLGVHAPFPLRVAEYVGDLYELMCLGSAVDIKMVRSVQARMLATRPGVDRLEFQGVSDDVIKAEIEKNTPQPQEPRPPEDAKLPSTTPRQAP